MNMTLTIQSVTGIRARGRRKIVVEMDADRLEKMAAVFGMFNPAFLEAVEQSERDYKAGRVRRVNSLRELIR